VKWVWKLGFGCRRPPFHGPRSPTGSAFLICSRRILPDLLCHQHFCAGRWTLLTIGAELIISRNDGLLAKVADSQRFPTVAVAPTPDDLD
jgi:hypothetical protein